MDYRVEKLINRLIYKKVAVYGTGIYAKRVIEALGSCQIVGVLDGAVSSGEYAGNKIISTDEMILLHPQAVIAAAQLSSTLAIYYRIHLICREHQIALLDVWGNDLLRLMDDLEKQKENVFSKNLVRLQREIDRHEIISFDVFDTVIMRNTLYPMDVFDIMEEKVKGQGICVTDFGKTRALAEQSVDCISPNIYQIYDAFQKRQRISDLQKRVLLDMELQIERQVLIVRDDIVKAVQYAIQKGKKVYFISDMYLPKELLSEILDSMGVEGYQDLLVSCDYHQTKYMRLYKLFMDKYPARSYLHIGDNIEADGFCAKAHGMDVYVIPSALELLRVSSYRELLKYVHTLNERSMLGMLIARIFRSPFALFQSDGRPFINHIQDIAYLYFAPLITKLLIWLVEEAECGDYDKILFSARDGFFIRKLYSFVKEELHMDKLPQGVYFYASRMLCALAGMQNESDLAWMLSAPFDSSWQEVLAERFDLKKEELMNKDSQAYASVEEYAVAHKEIIYAHSKEVRKNYEKYMHQLGLKSGEKYAFFDFVSCGTCQYFLSRNVSFSLEGLYCGYYDSVTGGKRNVPIKALFVNKNYFKKETFFFKNYLIYETVMTSKEASVRNMDACGRPIFANETRNMHQLEVIDQVQEEIFKYVKQFITALYVRDSVISSEYVDRIFALLAQKYTNENCDDLDYMELVDDFGNNILKLTRDQMQ